MVGGDHFLHHISDPVLLILVGNLHQLIKLSQEGIDLEADRFSDVYEVIVGLHESLLGHELFFIELLAGAQPGVFNFNIDVRFKTGHTDQVSGEGVDPDRAAHIQDEDLSAMGVGAGEQNQAHRLGNGHEIADDIRVGHGHRTALFDLFPEKRDHGPVAAQDISEADSDKFRPDILKILPCAVSSGSFDLSMGKNLRDLGCFSGLDLGIEGLDDHLADACRCRWHCS